MEINHTPIHRRKHEMTETIAVEKKLELCERLLTEIFGGKSVSYDLDLDCLIVDDIIIEYYLDSHPILKCAEGIFTTVDSEIVPFKEGSEYMVVKQQAMFYFEKDYKRLYEELKNKTG